MGKQPNKQNNKNQSVLKMGVGGKWEKISRKKVIKGSEKLHPINEVEEKEETIQLEKTSTTMNEDGNTMKPTDLNVKDTEASAGEVKLLISKRKEITEDEDDQDVVLEMLRSVQAIVEYWIQNK